MIFTSPNPLEDTKFYRKMNLPFIESGCTKTGKEPKTQGSIQSPTKSETTEPLIATDLWPST